MERAHGSAGRSWRSPRFLFRRITVADLTAVAALLVSLWFGVFGPSIANIVTPKIDVQPPKELQFNCSPRAPDPNEEGRYPCSFSDAHASSITVELFSFWNESRFSNRGEIVHTVMGEMIVGERHFPLRLEYFTESTDRPGDHTRNAARFVLRRGQIVNLEMRFSYDSPESDRKWGNMLELLSGTDEKRMKFTIDFEHNRDTTFRCEFNVGGRNANRLGKHYFFVVKGMNCVEASEVVATGLTATLNTGNG